jgi:hypothetical protein
MAANRPRTTSGSQPGFMTSEVHGELLAAFMDDAADRYARDAAESGTPALAEATVRMVRRAAIELRAHHGVRPDALDIEFVGARVEAMPEQHDGGES